MNERKVGDVFEYDGKKYKMVAATADNSRCKSCAFINSGKCQSVVGTCMGAMRIDSTPVYCIAL